MKAIWNGKVIAESNDIVNVEGNSYFPIDSINKEFFKENDTHTVCHWKGTASYYDLHIADRTNTGAAWYYPNPGDRAKSIAGRVAFWKGIQIVKD